MGTENRFSGGRFWNLHIDQVIIQTLRYPHPQ
jgi:hypothetical protein